MTSLFDQYDDDGRDDGVDASTAFWGSTREWPDTGPVPRVGRERTGSTTRTRSHHAVSREAAPAVADAGEEPEVDVVLDDDGGDAASRPPRFAERLGLGHVDPLIVRIGVMILVAVLLVPLALSLRPTPPPPSVTTGTPAPPDPAGAVPLESPTAAGVVDAGPASSGTPAGAVDVPATSDDATAVAAVIDPSTLPPAPIVNPDAGTTQDATQIDGAADGDAVQSSGEATLAESAEADAPAARVVRSCPQRYTVADGDYWLRLADSAGVALGELLRLNGATVDTPLYPGAEVCVPAGAARPAEPATTTATASPSAAPTPPAAPPTTQAPAYVWVDDATAQQIIRDVWPDDLEERALQVAFRESRYDVTAKNYCCYGLFQIYWRVHRDWLADLGITTAEQLFDARLNATAAYTLYQRSGGWGPWT